MEALTEPREWRAWRTAAAAVVFGYTLLYAGAVDYFMIRDSRYEVDRWLKARLGAGQAVGFTGQREYNPTLDGLNHIDIPDVATLERVHPAYMLFNADYGRAVARDVIGER